MSDDSHSSGAHASGAHAARIRASSLAPIVEQLDRSGAATTAMMTRRLLTRDQLADPYGEVPLTAYVALLEDAAAQAADPLLGARIGAQFRPGNLGPVGLLFGASATLRRGLERLTRWLAVWQDATVVRIEDDGSAVTWSYRLDDPAIWPRRQDAEYTLAATIALAREAFGASCRPVAAHLEHGAADDAAPLSRLLGVRPLFAQTANRLVFARADCDRPHRREDRDLMTILERHVADLFQPAPGEAGLVARVRTLVLAQLGRRKITLPTISATLNVSARTLQRRLAEEGTSLRALVLECRMELGRVHLRDGRISNAEIARTLGYADSTAFWRAFKTAAGTSPSEFRPPR
ncbi:AraC-like transcriptional regulator QhpR [Rubrimonas cliftonensis]|uniref:AraC-type DNA-binding protein n=1 Tax=Rubrimonas cliftonensis TaxID=89524 RepID=A0A1H4FMQ5_9RHOB|nr:AraC family transcriptional regulator [Rubrimonas cliftonensis]SEA97998.1 AraC-type DNA-binding protein [Rubrimonas cliftonensis]